MIYKKHIEKQDIDRIFDAMANDYEAWMKRACESGRWTFDEQCKEEFKAGCSVNNGSSYIKLVSKNSVVGFIVNTHRDKKFEYGDLLKASSWTSPARNFSRGNIFDDTLEIRWTGIS